MNDKPIQYQRGYVEFYKLKFRVTPDVLIPRPETELLVDEVLDILNKHITILDVGTGSGNIAISLACNLRSYNVNIIATDISQKALKVAKQNARLHGVAKQITFIQGNLLDGYDRLVYHTKIDKPDIIVTNLPYIPSARIPYLDPSVKDFEPHLALDGGQDGFELYRKLFRQIKHLSTPGVDLKLHSRCVRSKPKLIICEIDYTHGELAVLEAQKYFPEAEIEVKKDLAKKQRVLLIRQFL